jgi:hypothetical protein
MCFAHSINNGRLLARYNENGNTNNVKVMNHVDMLLWTMDHPPPTNMYVIDLARWCIQGFGTLATCP